jgi:casein kinase II subunit beta
MLSGILRSSTTSSSEESDESSLSDMSSSYSWITWYVTQPGHEFLVEIDEEFIRDNFNLYGLRPFFQFYDQALEMILDQEAPDDEDLQDQDFLEVYKDACELYGLIHTRFIMSPRGLSILKERYLNGDYGACPRIHCLNQKCLPIGTSDEIHHSTAKVFCPLCEQVYAPRTKPGDAPTKIDGAFFGSSLPHMLLQTYPDLLPLERPEPYEAKIFGFRVHGQKSVIRRKVENEARGIRAPRPLQSAVNGPRDLDSDESS